MVSKSLELAMKTGCVCHLTKAQSEQLTFQRCKFCLQSSDDLLMLGDNFSHWCAVSLHQRKPS